MIHNSLAEFLKTDPELVGIFDGRVWHEWQPQEVATWPVLSFQEVAASPFADDMESPGQIDIEQSNYQLDVWARSSADVISASEALLIRMEAFRGTMGAVRVQHVEFANRTQLGDIIGNKQVRRVSMDFRFYYDLNGAT